MFARLRALAEGGRLPANESVLVLLSDAIKANVLNCGLLSLITDCAVSPVNMILALERLQEIDLTAPNCVGWFL